MTDDARTVARVEGLVGHPGDKWDALKSRVQDEAIKSFSIVEADWLDVLYTLDAYRSASVVPREMGKASLRPGDRLAGVYRGKGNWYADLISILLGNRTNQRLAPRSRVAGFSQLHQIDVAWPDRTTKPIQDPLICLETKLTGAPGYGDTKERTARADWTNRRKELKFAATDLKLSRRASETKIDHWDVWRFHELPKCYFLWGARLTPKDNIDRMVREVQALTNTYLDGAGLFPWRLAGDHYEQVDITGKFPSDRVSTIDDLLRKVASEIAQLAPDGQPPAQRNTAVRSVDVEDLEPDEEQ